MRVGKESSERTACLRIRNLRAGKVLFYLEPWGEQYTMAPNDVFQIVAHGPEGGCLELEYREDDITLYGWTGCAVSVFQDGVELGAGSFDRAAVPPLPNDNK